MIGDSMTNVQRVSRGEWALIEAIRGGQWNTVQVTRTLDGGMAMILVEKPEKTSLVKVGMGHDIDECAATLAVVTPGIPEGEQ